MTSERVVAYEAEFEKLVVVRQPDGTHAERRQHFKLFRDGKGRWRQEVTIPLESGGAFQVAFLNDLARGRMVLLDLATGRVLHDVSADRAALLARFMAEAPSVTGPAMAPPDVLKDESLGERRLEGVTAIGRRVVTAVETTETWQAELIDQPALFVRVVRGEEESIERLYNIRIGEPAPALMAPLDE